MKTKSLNTFLFNLTGRFAPSRNSCQVNSDALSKLTSAVRGNLTGVASSKIFEPATTCQVVVTCLFFLTLFTSCEPGRIFEENKTIRDYNWDYNLPIPFTVNITDTVTNHNMYLNVRNAGFYNFSNLFLFVNTIMPNGETLRDTVEIPLAGVDGKWLGSGLGDIYDNRYLFRKNFKFPQTGNYRFELIQAMRVNPLPGIMDAGVRIEKSAR